MSVLGTADLGIVGRNLIYEEGVDVEELVRARLRLLLARRRRPARFALPVRRRRQGRQARDLLSQFGSTLLRRAWAPTPEIITLSGSVEMAPGPRSGRRHRRADRDRLDPDAQRSPPDRTILESEAVLVANRRRWTIPRRSVHIDRLLMRINAVRAARRYKYVMMNAPESALDDIKRSCPGSKSPTVVPLADRRAGSRSTLAIEEDVFWESIEQLRERRRVRDPRLVARQVVALRPDHDDVPRPPTSLDLHVARPPRSSICRPMCQPTGAAKKPERLIRLDMNESPYRPVAESPRRTRRLRPNPSLPGFRADRAASSAVADTPASRSSRSSAAPVWTTSSPRWRIS